MFGVRRSALGVFFAHKTGNYKIDISGAEGDLDVTRSFRHFAVRRDQPETVDGVGNGDVPRLIILIAHNRAKVSFVGKLHRFHAEARSKNTIERGRCTAALQMSKNATARFFPGAGSNFASNKLP